MSAAFASSRLPGALTIAGSDSGGGAGIQADLKTFAAHGVHGLSAIAALTAQNTRGVSAVHVPPVDVLRAQIDACFDDFSIGAVKLGMLANAQVIHAVADALETYQPRFVVLDPVMVATSGAKLLEDEALDALKSRLLPLASIVTPNIPEAEILYGRRIRTTNDMHDCAIAMRYSLAQACLVKGGHLQTGDEVIDIFCDEDGTQPIIHERLPLEAHGTGCTLASAIAANLCLGRDMPESVREAIDYVERALRLGYRPGRSDIVVLDHFGAAPRARR
ncbi:MAG: bifunctional hydroxymethylpyrimidine kinase/phosphomethylpyrimidine kinase [Thermomonas sp.]